MVSFILKSILRLFFGYLLYLLGLFKNGCLSANPFLLKANPLFTRAFKRFFLRSLLNSFLFLSLYSFRLHASIVPVDPCHDPLEIAALFSNMQQPKNTLEGQIKKKEGLLEKRQKLLEMLMEGDGNYSFGIEGYIDDLSNSLDKDTLDLRKETIQSQDDQGKSVETVKTETVYKVASDLASYMENQESGWDCEEGGNGYPCRAWQKEESDSSVFFKSRGKINDGFCVEHAANPKDCKKALRKLKEDYAQVRVIEKQMATLEDEISTLRRQQWEKELSGESEEKQAGFEPCWSCLQDVRDMNKPGWGEVVGNTLTTAMGVGLSVYGAKLGRRAGVNANELWALQGVPARNNFGYSLAGASLGFPFIQKGIHGFTQGNAARGGFGCGQTASHHASMHPMMQQQMMQHQMQQQAMMHGGNPLAMAYGNGPMAQFQMNNPLAMPTHPMAQFHVNNPLAMPTHPMAQFHVNNPWAMPGTHPMAQFQVNNPFAMPTHPMAQFHVNNPLAMNSMMQMPGMNSAYATQHSQYAMQQLQMKMQIQKAVMAQQQSIMQERMQTQQVLAGLIQEAHKINATIDLVAKGGVRALAGAGSLSAGFTIGSITGTPGVPGLGGGPNHNPLSPPTSTPGTGTTPIRVIK